MSSRPSLVVAKAARTATVCFGLATLGWCWFAAPLLWNQPAMALVAKKVIAGDLFGPSVLADFSDAAERDVRNDICQPTARRAIAIIRVRLAEEALAAGNDRQIKQTQAALGTALSHALGCMPTDPFLWFALFWVQNNVNGLQQTNFNALRMSYRFGPNEGWLAIKRNRYAIAVYPVLPEDLKISAMEEFVQLVKSDFITDAAEVVAGPGKTMRETMLARLEGIDQGKLRFLARLLDGKGIEARIPGVQISSRDLFNRQADDDPRTARVRW